jgi:glycosyltransferase involved in cell wall biosynthesis
MRIALVNSEYPSRDGHGGIATYTYTLANALAGQGNTVHVLARLGSRPDSLAPNIRFHTFGFNGPSRIRQRLDMAFYKGPVRWEIGQARSIREVLLAIHSREGLDVAEFPEYGGLAFACSGPIPFPVVIAFHTPTEMVDSLNNTPASKGRKLWYRFEKKALLCATAFRSPSESLKQFAIKHYNLSPSSITIIRNPIDTPLYEKIKRSYPTDDDNIDLLFAGRLEHRKGVDILSTTIKDLLKIEPTVTMTFAGECDIPSGPNYRLRIENSLSDQERQRIWFLGPINRGELAVLYCRSSIFLMPSLFENAPYALMEAMASKLPIVAAATGGIAEIVQHKINGQLFSLDDPRSLITCIADYINDPYLARSCAEQAFVDVKKRYAPDSIASESIVFYQSAIQIKSS